MHYRTGTISLTNGLATITGTGTDWISGAAVGECVQAPDGKIYEIASIQSATALTLGQVYLGATAAGQSYSIVPTQSYMRDVASQAASLVNGMGDTSANAIKTNAADKATIVDTDKLGGRDIVTGAARLFSFSAIKTALKSYFDTLATTLTNKTLTAPVLSNPSYSGATANGGTVTTIDINGGTVDGTVIGGAVPAAGSFTTLSSSGALTTAAIKEVSGNVGIGTSSPSANLDIEGLGNNVAAHIFTSDNVQDATASLVFGTTPGARSKASIQMLNTSTGNGSGALAFSTNNGTANIERLRIDSAGNVLIGKTTTTSGGGDLQVSKGITFPATQVASADANTLDDYREGTFTPTIAGTASTGVGTYTAQVGRYTKVGNTVTFTIVLTWTAHTATGDIRLYGLPFASQNTSSLSHVVANRNASLTLTANNVLSTYLLPNSIEIYVRQIPVGGGVDTAVAMDGAATIAVSGSYFV